MSELFVPPATSGSPRKYNGEGEDLWNVIGFDPGGTTGWAQFSFWKDGFAPDEKLMEYLHSWSCGQFTGPEDAQVDAMAELVDGWPVANTEVVIEDFILRAYRRGRELLAPVRITAAFEYEYRWIGVPRRGRGHSGGKQNKRIAIRQQPSLAMTCMTDDRLRAMGMYNPTAGQEHARDAVRHCLTWARRRKEGYEFTE